MRHHHPNISQLCGMQRYLELTTRIWFISAKQRRGESPQCLQTPEGLLLGTVHPVDPVEGATRQV